MVRLDWVVKNNVKRGCRYWDDPNSLSGSNMMGLGHNGSKKTLYLITSIDIQKKYPRSGVNQIVPLGVLCLNGAWS